MANRTIYVADTDLPVFEKAQQLAGDNLSATIVQALRRFVETEEARSAGYEEITVHVGRGRPYVQKQFRGRPLAKRRTQLGNESRMLTLVVYQTIHGRLALYSKNSSVWDWSSYASNRASKKSDKSYNGGWDWGWDWDWDWSGSGESGRKSAYEPDERRFDVYENLEALKVAIPEEMYESIAHHLQHGDDIEFLDI